jgi:hypothetical protein
VVKLQRDKLELWAKQVLKDTLDRQAQAQQETEAEADKQPEANGTH